MGRFAQDDTPSALEFLGLITGSAPAPAPTAAVAPVPASPTVAWSLGADEPAAPAVAQAIAPAVAPAISLTVAPGIAPAIDRQSDFGQPLTRREARARENAAAAIEAVAVPIATLPTSAMTSPALPSRRDARTAAPVARREPATPAPRPERGGSRSPRPPVGRGKAAASKSLTLVAMLFVTALLVGMSVPANAFIAASPSAAAPVAARAVVGAQSVSVADDAATIGAARDSFDVISYAEIMREKYGDTPMTFTPTTGAVRWPFPYSVPISDGWGARVAPCAGCSTFHQGVDFTPGGGTPIYAIADGVVTSHDDTNYGLGNNVLISHVINGQNIDSVYAHMLTGSSTLKPGDVIKVGDFVGLVGDTGSSTGNHLHFEIHVDKVPVDPFAWLTANAVN